MPVAEVTGVDSADKFETMRHAGFDHLIDYKKEDFTRIGRRYDLIVDTKTMRQPSDHIRALNPGGTYATLGGPSMLQLLQIPLVGWWFRLTTGRTVSFALETLTWAVRSQSKKPDATSCNSRLRTGR